MNIDKFGHHVHKRLRLTDYFDLYNDALLKSDTGHYDLKQNRLLGLPTPVYDNEAANKQYLDQALKKYYLKKEIDVIVKSILDSSLLQFKQKLDKIIVENYYTKPEIDHMLKNRVTVPTTK